MIFALPIIEVIVGFPLTLGGLGWMAQLFYVYGKNHAVQPQRYPRFTLVFALMLMPLGWATYLIYLLIEPWNYYEKSRVFFLRLFLLLAFVLFPVCRLSIQDSKRLTLPFLASLLLAAAGMMLLLRGGQKTYSMLSSPLRTYDYYDSVELTGWEAFNETCSLITLEFDQCSDVEILTDCMLVDTYLAQFCFDGFDDLDDYLVIPPFAGDTKTCSGEWPSQQMDFEYRRNASFGESGAVVWLLASALLGLLHFLSIKYDVLARRIEGHIHSWIVQSIELLRHLMFSRKSHESSLYDS